jgi:hypothetical protein
VNASQHVVIGVPDEGWSRWEQVGPSRRIVTYTRVKVEETVAGVASDSELLVRTLGGQVDGIGQVVSGEAVLVPGERALMFVRQHSDGTLGITGMAQGHYNVRADAKGVFRIFTTQNLPELVGGTDQSAVARLSGRTLSECHRMIAEAAKR